MKLAGIALGAGLALGSFGASAAFIGSIDLSSGSGGFVSTPIAGSFVDTAAFTLVTPSTVTGILASAVGGTQDVDFTSITLTGPSGLVSFASADPDPFETWTISAGALPPGVYTLTATGTNSASVGSYVGNITVTPDGVGPVSLITISAFIGSIDLSSGSGGFVSTPIAGSFVDTAAFTLVTPSTVTGILASAVGGTQDVDFTSITLTGPSGLVSFASADPDPFETWTISAGALPPGVYTLTATGTNSASVGSYVGNITVTPDGVGPPLPEPATYALMLVALGAMHFVTRRRKVPIRRLA